jgi:hypothetical protein
MTRARCIIFPALGLVLSICLSLLNCSGLPNQSPTETLSNLVYAYNHNLFATAHQTYRNCLLDDYLFHFRAEDVGKEVDGYTIPETWSVGTDSLATYHLFDDVSSISLDIPQSETGLGEPSGDSFLVSDVSFNLTVYANQSTVYAASGAVDIEFRQDADGDWLIYQLWDKSTSPTSWGWIKAKYYQPL